MVQLIFNKNNELKSLLRSNKNLSWSKTMSCWYLPFYKTLAQDLKLLLNQKNHLDDADLKIDKKKLVKKSTMKSIPVLNVLSAKSLQKVENFKY